MDFAPFLSNVAVKSCFVIAYKVRDLSKVIFSLTLYSNSLLSLLVDQPIISDCAFSIVGRVTTHFPSFLVQLKKSLPIFVLPFLYNVTVCCVLLLKSLSLISIEISSILPALSFILTL